MAVFNLSGGGVASRDLLPENIRDGVSIGGAAGHNCGQIAAAMITLGNTAPLYYLPILLGVSLGTGAVTGLVCAGVFRTLNRTGLMKG